MLALKGIRTWIAVAAALFCLGLYIPDNAQAVRDEAGFIRLDPVDFSFSFGGFYSRLPLRSSPARIWYSFLSADDDSDHKPLFVFFNGGPGSATSSGLMSMNTGRWTMEMAGDLPSGRFIPNPYSWTQLGNLIYIDARQTGFSYCLMDNPGDPRARRLEFNAQNFNPYFDAADFIRVILAFFDSHPQLRGNRIILVPESYGGERATVILYILLNYKLFGNGGFFFQDRDLVDKLQAHYDLIFPEYKGGRVPPEVIAKQFSHQIMIQPVISLGWQDTMTGEEFEKPDSIIYKLAAEVGKTYTPCTSSSCDPYDNAAVFVMDIAGRDLYNYIRPVNNLNDGFAKAAEILQKVQNLSLVTGTDVMGITDLYASARSKAYRTVSESAASSVPSFYDLPLREQLRALEQKMGGLNTQSAPYTRVASDGDLSTYFGSLLPWDRYMLDTNQDATTAFYFNVALQHGYGAYPNAATFGYLFLANIPYVKTFISDARLDLRVYTPLLPAVLARYNTTLESAVHEAQQRLGEDRPGRIVLTYKYDQYDKTRERIIRFPAYLQSGHAVTYYEPEAIRSDVSSWLAETGGAFQDYPWGSRHTSAPKAAGKR